MTRWFLCLSLWIPLTSVAEPLLVWERQQIGQVNYEAASVFDVDQDGYMDIVSGEYWFAGPDFKEKIKICDIQYQSEYHDSFADIPCDVNGDGFTDIVTGGWFGETVRWRENPKERGVLWKTHDIGKVGNIETMRAWDVDGDGTMEFVPNAGGSVVFFRLVTDTEGKGTGQFTRHVVKEGGCGHGLGFGDINGDGRGDFVVPEGWIEAPEDPLKGEWVYHQEFALGAASVPILVHDVDEDGLADLIVGEAHNDGLYWLHQSISSDGKRVWQKNVIDSSRSQYHDLILADLDNDGKSELLTGKRYRAHNGHDPGETDPVGVYYFSIENGRFHRKTLDYGNVPGHSGFGIYAWVEDVDANGFKDLIAPGKEGLFLFRNMGPVN